MDGNAMPDSLFWIASNLALAGWLALAAGIVLNRPLLRDSIAGLAVPLLLSLGYAVLVAAFWWTSEGGFGSLSDVQRLFTSPWIALAGWVHYLAYDLFIGAAIARKLIEAKFSRLLLIPILPLAFLFGPIGFLLAQSLLLTARRA